MSTTTQPLKYLWTAYYKDGSSLTQPKNDRSKDHDENSDWNPSSYRDIDQDKLQFFALQDHEEEREFGVNLDTGEFYVNGVPFIQHDQNFQPGEPLRLIYFREMRKDWIDGVEQEPYVNRYFIGWQAKDINGKNHQYTLGVG